MPWSQLNFCVAIASLAAYVGLHVLAQQGLFAYIPLRLAQPLLLVCLCVLCAALFTLLGAWKRKGPSLFIGVPLMVANVLSAIYLLVHTVALYLDTAPRTLEDTINPGMFSSVDSFLVMLYPQVQSITLLLAVACIAELITRGIRKNIA
ncbi:MAG: hypothetical protein AAGC84_10720 [Pseudomonas sp.]